LILLSTEEKGDDCINLFFLLLLVIQGSISNTHKLAKSYEDAIINDINNPLSQEQILNLINLKVFYNNEDVTNYVTLIYDDYKNNNSKEGMFEQVYELNYKNIKESYVITIYNINLNNDFSININIKKGKELNIKSIVSKVIEKYNLTIYEYEIIESNYKDSKTIGNYYKKIRFLQTNNETIEVIVNISILNNTFEKYIIFISISIIISLILTTTIYKFIKNKRRIESV